MLLIVTPILNRPQDLVGIISLLFRYKVVDDSDEPRGMPDVDPSYSMVGQILSAEDIAEYRWLLDSTAFAYYTKSNSGQ